MTTIPPSIPIPVAAITGGTDLTALLTQLPPDLASVGRGAAISGTVIAVDSQGQVLLQTNAGVVGFQSLVSVSVGQQVTLQVQSTAGGQVQAMIVAAEAKAMNEIGSAGGPAQAPDAAPAEVATPAATVAPSVASGSVIVATVIASASAGQSTASSVPASTGAGATATAAASPPGAATAATPAGAASLPVPSSGAGTPAAAPALAAAPTPSSPANASPAPVAGAPSSATGPAAAPTPAAATPLSAPAQGAAPATAPVAGASLAPANLPAPATPSAAAPTSPPPAAAAALPPRAVSVAIASYAASASAGTPAAASPPPASNTAAPLPAPPPGTLVPLRFVGPLPSLAAAAASASNGQVVATVVARTQAGQMIVDTAIGRLAFTAPAADTASVGSQIAFEIAAPALRPGMAALAAAAPLATGRGLAGLATEWPALKDAISALTVADPALARQVLETSLPQLGSPRFVEQVLSFLATSPNDVKTLLGQAALDTLLQAGHGDVVGHLQADLGEMSRLNSAATDWRVFYLPLLDPTQIRQLRVFTRRRKAGTDWRRDSGRFVVDVEFESLGPLQLDGLVQTPRLDLILRSHTELPGALRSGISEVFARTCETAGLSGKIFFQALPSFPVSPFDEMSKSPMPGVSV
jgi:hypothetical protein